MSNSRTPFQTHSFTSNALLHYTARATQPVLEIGQHRYTTKQLEHSNATTSPRLQLQRLSTKETILQPELKVRLERMLETSLSNLLYISQAAITTPPTATTEQTTTSHQLKSSWVRFRTRGSRQQDARILKIPSSISKSLLSTPGQLSIETISRLGSSNTNGSTLSTSTYTIERQSPRDVSSSEPHITSGEDVKRSHP